MAENFQDNVSYGGSTLAVSGDAVKIGSTNAGAKSVIFASSNTEGHLNWLPTANRTISLPDAAGMVMLTSQAILSISAAGAAITSGQVVFSNSNNVSFGANGQTITATISVPAQSAQTQSNIAGVYDGANSISTGTIRFTNANGISFSINGQTISGSVAAQSVQTQSLIAGVYDGANSISTGTIRFTNANGVSFSINGQTISGSVAAQSVQTQSLIAGIYDGANSISTGTIRFTNANGVSFSINGQTISGSVAAQSNQTEGRYALGNTTGESSSSTFDARTMSISGAGNVSVGYSGNNLVISGGTAAPSPVNFSAGTASGNIGSVVFSNSNGISFGLNGSTITASASYQSEGWYGLGNTTQNSSTTLDGRSVSLNGLGAMTVGYSNGSIQLSAPVTSSLSATGAASISVNGSTISIGAKLNISAGTTSNDLTSQFVFSNSNNVSFGLNGSTVTASIPGYTAFTFQNRQLGASVGTAPGQNSVWLMPFRLGVPVSASTGLHMVSISGSVTSNQTNTVGLTWDGMLYKVTGTNTTRLDSIFSTRFVFTFWNSGTASVSYSHDGGSSSSAGSNLMTASAYGNRLMTFNIGSILDTGFYAWGFRQSTSSAGQSSILRSFNAIMDNPYPLGQGAFGAATNGSNGYVDAGTFSVTSGAMPATFGLSEIKQTMNVVPYFKMGAI